MYLKNTLRIAKILLFIILALFVLMAVNAYTPVVTRNTTVLVYGTDSSLLTITSEHPISAIAVGSRPFQLIDANGNIGLDAKVSIDTAGFASTKVLLAGGPWTFTDKGNLTLSSPDIFEVKEETPLRWKIFNLIMIVLILASLFILFPRAEREAREYEEKIITE